jgi:hypothetical protein
MPAEKDTSTMKNHVDHLTEVFGLPSAPPQVVVGTEIELEPREGIGRALRFEGWQASLDGQYWMDVPPFVTEDQSQNFYDGIIAAGGTIYLRRMVQFFIGKDDVRPDHWLPAGPAFVQGEWTLTMTKREVPYVGGEHA